MILPKNTLCPRIPQQAAARTLFLVARLKIGDLCFWVRLLVCLLVGHTKLKKCPTSFFYKTIGLKIFRIFTIVNISIFDFFFQFFFKRVYSLMAWGPHRLSPFFGAHAQYLLAQHWACEFFKNIIRNNKLRKLRKSSKVDNQNISYGRAS